MKHVYNIFITLVLIWNKKGIRHMYLGNTIYPHASKLKQQRCFIESQFKKEG